MKTGEIKAQELPLKVNETAPAFKAAQTNGDRKTYGPRLAVANKIIFTLAGVGIVAGLVAAYFFGLARGSEPPVFAPVSNPFMSAIFANGMIESAQPNGENINIFPEVSGPITHVLVHEGQTVKVGTPLFTIDDSVQRATTAQLKLQSEASLSQLNELKAEPRAETLIISVAQVAMAKSSLQLDRDQYDKDLASYNVDHESISLDVLDTAKDTVMQATSALDVTRKQYDLTKAGAWSYDLINQEKQYEALQQAYDAANALLIKYSVNSPVDGIVLAANTAVGSYVAPQGAYDSYTELFGPLIVMGTSQTYLNVRCYVDEILVSRLPSESNIKAQMQILGTDVKVPLEFVRVQPYVSPKIELSNQRQEQVDLRVLPVIFRFKKKDAPVYPGQMVNVFIGHK